MDFNEESDPQTPEQPTEHRSLAWIWNLLTGLFLVGTLVVGWVILQIYQDPTIIAQSLSDPDHDSDPIHPHPANAIHPGTYRYHHRNTSSGVTYPNPDLHPDPHRHRRHAVWPDRPYDPNQHAARQFHIFVLPPG